MNKEIVKEWVTALRSGEYKQGSGMLRSQDNKFCCLGVLCEMAAKHKVIPPASMWQNQDRYYYQDSGGFLPDSVKNWAGLSHREGKYGKGNNILEYASLAEKNDKGLSFAEIADIIESNPPGLFVEESDGDKN